MLATCMLAALVSIQVATDQPEARSEQPASKAPNEAEQPPPAGWTRPRLVDANCIDQRVSQTKLAQGVEVPPRVVVMFVVTSKGVVTNFRTLDEAPKELIKILYEAIWTCRWLPGTDRWGTPVTVSVRMPIRLVDEGAETQSATPKRQDASPPPTTSGESGSENDTTRTRTEE